MSWDRVVELLAGLLGVQWIVGEGDCDLPLPKDNQEKGSTREEVTVFLEKCVWRLGYGREDLGTVLTPWGLRESWGQHCRGLTVTWLIE